MLRSIRMFHQKYIAHRHCCQKTALRIFHHLKMELAEVLLATILLGYMYNLCINVFWASRAPTDRVYLQRGSWGHPLFSKLFAVKKFLWRRIQANFLHLGSDFAFQIGLMACLLVCPVNWIRYALLVVYSASGVHHHVISSSASGLRLNKGISSQRLVYSRISSPVFKGHTWSIQ